MSKYIIGGKLEFNSKIGSLIGIQINLDDFPFIDFVVVDQHELKKTYELTTGVEIFISHNSELDPYIDRLLKHLKNKKFTTNAFFGKVNDYVLFGQYFQYFLNAHHTVKNESHGFKLWQQLEKQRAETLPYLYSNEERKQISSVLKEAKVYKLQRFVEVLTANYWQRADGKIAKINVSQLHSLLTFLVNQAYLKSLRRNGDRYPRGVSDLIERFRLDWSGMLTFLGDHKSRAIVSILPEEVKTLLYKSYLLMAEVNNDYGYLRYNINLEQIKNYADLLRSAQNSELEKQQLIKYLTISTYEMTNLLKA